jgi:thymidylate synthase
MVNLIESKEGETLMHLWDKSVQRCLHVNKVSNLILTGTFPFSETNSNWIKNFKEKAKAWQEPERPPQLTLNHGEYIDRYILQFNKSGIDYIIDELKTKFDSNRACWSLFDMSTLIASGDKSIPSFMVLQTDISDDGSTLNLTVYFRALEVSKFLPINIAESCLVAEKLQKAFSYKFKQFSLTIHAFNAYVKENFACLEKAAIDLTSEAEIMMNIMTASTSKSWLKDVLTNKMETIESRINEEGINSLVKSIELYNARSKDSTSIVYDSKFVKKLKSVHTKIKEYNEIVYTSTYTSDAKSKYEEIRSELREAINLI